MRSWNCSLFLVLLSTLVFVGSIGCGGSDASPGPGPQDSGPASQNDGGTDAGGKDGGDLPACPGLELTQDGVLDVDVKTVKITGAITLNGKPLPSGLTGNVQFKERKTGVAYSFGLQPSYRAVIAPGEYDVLLAPLTACTGTNRLSLPCVAGTVKRAVALLGDGNLDIDIPTVEVSGEVTLNGKPLADASPGRGQLNWALKDGGNLAISLGTTGPKSYNLTLLPGVYSVALAANGALCGTSTSEIPCVGGPLKTDLAIQQNGNLDIDIPAVRVTGKVTLNTQVLPDVTTGRGALVFSRPGGTGQASLGASGPKDFAVSLLAGTYAVAYAPALESQCSSGQVTSALPCTGARLKENLDLTKTGNLDVDIPSVRVTGNVTYKGGAIPDAAQERGSITWNREQDATGKPVSLGSTGAKSFSLPLVPGTYTVGYSPNASACTADAWTFPCVAGAIKSQISIGQAGNLDIDIPSVRVTGNVTLDGRALPDQSGERGDLSFDLDAAKGGAAAIALGSTGAKSFARTLLPGTYSVGFHPRSGCTKLTPAGVPCVGGTLKAAVTLSSDGNLDIDIPVVTVRGSVTLNGAAMPEASSTRGQIVFGLLESGSRAEGLGIPASGPASYSTTLLRGRYVTLYQNNPALCRADSPFPCTSEVVKGCP